MSDDGKSDADNVKMTAPADFAGPGKNRRCTDIFCCLLICAAWVAMTGVGMVVTGLAESDDLPKGNPYRLINGLDFDGNICGITDRSYGSGDYKYNIESRSKAYYLPSGAAVCVSSCPSQDNYAEFICEYNKQAKIDELMDSDDEVDQAQATVKAWEYVSDYVCMPKIKTTEYIGYCVPDAATSAIENALVEESTGAYEDANTVLNVNATNVTISVNSDANDKDIWDKFQADMFTGAGVIFGFGMGVTALLGFVYLYILRIPGCLFTLVWGIIAAIEALVLLPGLILYADVYPSWKDDTNKSDAEANMILYLAYFLLALAAIWACVVCCLRRRIMLALGITQEAARAVNCMQFLIAFPVLQALAIAVFLIPFAIYSLFLASSGEVNVETYDYGGTTVSYKEFTYTDNQYYAGLYLLFVYFWTTQFVMAAGQIVVALAVSTWYFSRDKSQCGNTTVFSAIKMTFRYHLGTAAFGSLVIAIIKTIRAVIAYLQKKAKKSGSKAAQAVLCCIQCCMWCLEKCMKFMNKNAYIQTAIFGYSFCKAARKAFWLILRNILLIGAVGLVAEIVGLLGKLLVPCACAFLTFLVLSYGYADELYTLWTPLIFTVIISYFTTEVFIEIFQMSISTILQCYVADKEMFPDNMYADGSLAATIGKTKKSSDEADAKAAKGGGCCGRSKKVAAEPQEAAKPAVEMTEVQQLNS